MKKLIKRLEEQAVEINELKKELNNNCKNGGYILTFDFGFKENETIIQEVKDKVFNELDKEEEATQHPFSNVIETFKEYSKVIKEVADALKIKDSQDFKKGDILIREWNDGVVDYCEFNEKINNKSFKLTNFSRINNRELNRIDGGTVNYIGYDCKFNWRKATQEEIDKLNKLLGKEEENKELEEAKEYLSISIKTRSPYTSTKMYNSIETILKHLE